MKIKKIIPLKRVKQDGKQRTIMCITRYTQISKPSYFITQGNCCREVILYLWINLRGLVHKILIFSDLSFTVAVNLISLHKIGHIFKKFRGVVNQKQMAPFASNKM